MAAKRKIEIFSAGCRLCDETVRQVHEIACPSCEVVVNDMNDRAISARAETLGIKAVPAVAVNGVLIPSLPDGALDFDALRAAGLGQPNGD